MPSKFPNGIIIVSYFQNLQHYPIQLQWNNQNSQWLNLLNFLGLTLTHEFNFALNYAAQS